MGSVWSFKVLIQYILGDLIYNIQVKKYVARWNVVWEH